ncbi:MAG: enoyl-CoA hydratase-related protein [Magnetovibrio sp.]|nr:enoyl-CoA hydratase-related protein [Magnetovibrio sp.]
MGEIRTETREVEGAPVARVVIDRAAKLNALDTPLTRTLTETIQGLGAEAGLRAVVIEGAGDKAWVGGGDIGEMAALDTASARAFIGGLHDAMVAVRDLPVPVIAAVGGYTLGAGMELAAACDMRIASTAAHFGMPEVQVGLPSVIEASLLPGLMGRGRAARLMLTGEVIDAQRAYEWGFVEEVVAPDKLADAVDAVLGDLCRAGPLAVRSQKRLMRQWEAMTPDAAAEASIATFVGTFEADEASQRLGTFANRRKG